MDVEDVFNKIIVGGVCYWILLALIAMFMLI